jgi:hypothetical protein
VCVRKRATAVAATHTHTHTHHTIAPICACASLFMSLSHTSISSYMLFNVVAYIDHAPFTGYCCVRDKTHCD